jgi:hypothetical protein
MKTPAANRQDQGPWPLIAKLASATWLAIVVVFVVRGLSAAPSFEQAAKESCTQLLLPVYAPFEQFMYKIDRNRYPQILHWKDRLSGEEILPYRRGMKSLDCDSLDHKVAVFAQASKRGWIEPVIGINWVRAVLIVLVPSLLIFVFCYLMGTRPKKPKKPAHRIS